MQEFTCIDCGRVDTVGVGGEKAKKRCPECQERKQVNYDRDYKRLMRRAKRELREAGIEYVKLSVSVLNHNFLAYETPDGRRVEIADYKFKFPIKSLIGNKPRIY